MIMLPVQVDELTPDLLKRTSRRERVVDEATAPALGWSRPA